MKHGRQGAARDLLAACDHLRFHRVTFADIRDALPLIEKADSPEGEEACIEFLAALPEADETPMDSPRLRDIVRELCNYPPDARRNLLQAAEDLADSEASIDQRFEDLLPAVLSELQGLDGRTRAILTVLEELRAAGRSVTDARYCDIPDELGAVDIDALRSEPGLTATMKAYDLARVALEHSEDVQRRRP